MNRVAHPNKSSQPMPRNVRMALAKRELTEAFRARTDYQQNEYLKWIATAAGEVTKQKRLDQMLDELEKGGVYMAEPWAPPVKPS